MSRGRGGPVWTLQLPTVARIMSMNDRVSWAERHARTRRWRDAARVAALEARVPHLDRALVTLDVHPPDRRRRDAENLALTLKALVDGLRDARVVDDDDPAHVTSAMPRLLDPQPHPELGRRWVLALHVADPDRLTAADVAAFLLPPDRTTPHDAH